MEGSKSSLEAVLRSHSKENYYECDILHHRPAPVENLQRPTGRRDVVRRPAPGWQAVGGRVPGEAVV
jgi:hypothetical protein